MSQPIEPIGTPTDSFTKFIWKTSIVDPTAPTVAEMASSDLSGYFTEFPWNNSEDTAATPRINQTLTPTGPGRRQLTLNTMYVTNPQSDTEDEAFEAFVHRSLGYLFIAYGIPWEDALEAGDIVYGLRVAWGAPIPSPAANTDLLIAQVCYVKADYGRVAVVAS